jgi:hypothetical protein
MTLKQARARLSGQTVGSISECGTRGSSMAMGFMCRWRASKERGSGTTARDSGGLMREQV